VEILDTDIETMSRTLLFLYAGDYNDNPVPFLGKGTFSLLSNGNYSEVGDDSSTLIGSPSSQPRITMISANPKPERSSTETTMQQVKQLLAIMSIAAPETLRLMDWQHYLRRNSFHVHKNPSLRPRF
jgi:hypothetical protein